jgi:hypothetical protein
MLTVKEIKDAIFELRAVDLQIDALNEQLKKLNEEKSGLKAKLTLMLKECGEKNFTCELGTVTKVTDYSVNMPQGEAKQDFFNFLRERGVFESMATVNHQTLNAYYKEQWELAKQGDPMAALNFSLPGIGEPKSFETIRFRKK